MGELILRGWVEVNEGTFVQFSPPVDGEWVEGFKLPDGTIEQANNTNRKLYYGQEKEHEIYEEQELRTITVMGSTAIPRDIFDFIEEFFTEAVKPAARNPITQADTPKLWGLQQLRDNRNTLLDGLQQWIDDPAKTWQDIRDFDVEGWTGWAIARPA